MIKLFVSTLCLSLCMVAPTMAQNKTSAGQKPQQARTQTPQSKSANKTADKHAQQKDSFTPSEKIRADTVVAFPADI